MRVQAMCDELRSANHGLEQELDVMRGDVAALESRCEDLEKRYADEVAARERERQEAEAERGRVSSQLDRALQQCQELEGVSAHEQRQRVAAEAAAAEAHAQLGVCNEELRRVEQSLESERQRSAQHALEAEQRLQEVGR